MFTTVRTGTIGSASRAARSQSASFYERGSICAAADDFIEAHKWFNLAARHGDPLGATARADMAIDMTALDIAEAQRRARTFLLN